MNNIRQNLGNIVIVVLAMLVVYMFFEPRTGVEVVPLPVEEETNQPQEEIKETQPQEQNTVKGFAPVPNNQKCSCGCSNCSCNPSSCKCGQIMNASDQMAVAVQGKPMVYDCGCGCSHKNKPSVTVSNPEFLNEWANFRSNANQNSNNIVPDTVDLIHQMYVDDNMMPSRKYKGKTISEVFDKMTNKSDFMRCVRLPEMEDQPMVGVNPYDPTEINF